MRNLIFAVVAASSLALPSESMAFAINNCFGTPIRWPANSATIDASAISFPAGNFMRTALETSVDRANAHPTPFFFILGSDSDGVNLNNSDSEIWGTTDAVLLDGSPAFARIWWTCFQMGGTTTQRINEGDIVWDYRAPFQWDTSELKQNIINYLGTQVHFQSTAIHEFGHVAGLNHVNTEYNIMGTDREHIFVNGSVARGYVGEDGADGHVALYGIWSADWEDVSVSHWRYDSAVGEYSSHEKGSLYNNANVRRPTTMVRGEVGYVVRPGQAVLAEFTYENNGKTGQIVNVGYYISTNHVISRSDRVISGRTGMFLGRNDVLTFRHPLRIPNDLADGIYWLGVVVDKNRAVTTDRNPENNATYIPIRVKRP